MVLVVISKCHTRLMIYDFVRVDDNAVICVLLVVMIHCIGIGIRSAVAVIDLEIVCLWASTVT